MSPFFLEKCPCQDAAELVQIDRDGSEGGWQREEGDLGNCPKKPWEGDETHMKYRTAGQNPGADWGERSCVQGCF